MYELLPYHGKRLDVDAFLINICKFRVEHLVEMQKARVIDRFNGGIVIRALSFLIKTSVGCPLTSLSLKASFSTTGARGFGGMKSY